MWLSNAICSQPLSLSRYVVVVQAKQVVEHKRYSRKYLYTMLSLPS